MKQTINFSAKGLRAWERGLRPVRWTTSGMIKSAYRKDGNSDWAITMDVKYLRGMIYEW